MKSIKSSELDKLGKGVTSIAGMESKLESPLPEPKPRSDEEMANSILVSVSNSLVKTSSLTSGELSDVEMASSILVSVSNSLVKTSSLTSGKLSDVEMASSILVSVSNSLVKTSSLTSGNSQMWKWQAQYLFQFQTHW